MLLGARGRSFERFRKHLPTQNISLLTLYQEPVLYSISTYNSYLIEKLLELTSSLLNAQTYPNQNTVCRCSHHFRRYAVGSVADAILLSLPTL